MAAAGAKKDEEDKCNYVWPKPRHIFESRQAVLIRSPRFDNKRIVGQRRIRRSAPVIVEPFLDEMLVLICLGNAFGPCVMKGYEDVASCRCFFFDFEEDVHR